MRPGFTALVVDDDDFCRHTASRILRRLGAKQLFDAADGGEALQCIAAHPGELDLIICDLKMPQVDGIEMLQSMGTGTASPLIILASGADTRVVRSVRDMAAEFGIRSLRTLCKPVTLQKLKDIFDDVDAEPSTSQAPAAKIRAPLDISVSDVRRGLANREFVAYFQPKIVIRSKTVVGAEALVRWMHPTYGVLSPGAFLPVVMEGGLMDVLTDLVLASAAAACAAWRAAGHDLSVNVNLSIASVVSDDLLRHMESITVENGLEPEHVTFEVTEDGWLKHQAVARTVLTRLRMRGFGLSIDDFGTGFSTLQQLLQAPFNEMKLDQSFVQSAPDDKESAVVLASSIALARSLGLSVVAEGVETDRHMRALEEAGCDIAQGYMIARPMPGEAFLDWLRAWELNARPVGEETTSHGLPAVA